MQNIYFVIFAKISFRFMLSIMLWRENDSRYNIYMYLGYFSKQTITRNQTKYRKLWFFSLSGMLTSATGGRGIHVSLAFFTCQKKQCNLTRRCAAIARSHYTPPTFNEGWNMQVYRPMKNQQVKNIAPEIQCSENSGISIELYNMLSSSCF